MVIHHRARPVPITQHHTACSAFLCSTFPLEAEHADAAPCFCSWLGQLRSDTDGSGEQVLLLLFVTLLPLVTLVHLLLLVTLLPLVTLILLLHLLPRLLLLLVTLIAVEHRWAGRHLCVQACV